MTTMTLQLNGTKADAFLDNACRIRHESEQLLTELIDDLITQPNTDFEEAVDRGLAINRELYRRLA